MRICDKINLDRSGLQEHGPITIVALGDSVTHVHFVSASWIMRQYIGIC